MSEIEAEMPTQVQIVERQFRRNDGACLEVALNISLSGKSTALRGCPSGGVPDSSGLHEGESALHEEDDDGHDE